MRTDQSRSNTFAQNLIANVEIGKFPSKAKVAVEPRWTESQQSKLDLAVSKGQWPPKDWLHREHDFLLPQQGLELFDKQGAPMIKEIAILSSMKKLEKSFLSARS